MPLNLSSYVEHKSSLPLARPAGFLELSLEARSAAVSCGYGLRVFLKFNSCSNSIWTNSWLQRPWKMCCGALMVTCDELDEVTGHRQRHSPGAIWAMVP